MYRLLRLIFLGVWDMPKKCEDRWKVREKYSFNIRFAKGVVYINECECCGELKSLKVDAIK